MSNLLPGTEVVARGLRWELVDTLSLGPQVLHRLRGIEGEMLGKGLDLLAPFEEITPVIHELRPERAAPLRNWLVYHQAFLLEQALGSEAISAVQPGRLRIEPYQLVPVLRALRMSRVRLLLADGVGLGKTIEAGLLLTELIARRIAHRILLVTPSGPLLEQWQMEMLQRFGLRFEVINRAKLDEVRRSNELGAIPFDFIPLGLASIDFLKQEKVLEDLERAAYDVVVIDEAHHCMDLGAAANEREDSLRRRLAEVLAKRCDALVLATATPHDGNDRSFASLCELLDPSLVDGRGVLRGDRYKAHVVRRLKCHVIDPTTGKQRFKEREVHPSPVVASPEHHAKFIKLQKSLLELLAPELRKAFRARRYSDVLAFIALLKRSVSSVGACKVTLSAVADRLQRILAEKVEVQENRRQRQHTLREMQRKQERFGVLSTEEESEQHALEVEDIAQTLAALQRETASDFRHVSRYSQMVEALNELLLLAEAAIVQDPKLDQLVAEIQKVRQTEPHANVLVYTEYVDSQVAILRALKDAALGDTLSMNGDDDQDRRIQVTGRFCTADNLVLVSTDAAAEGLNLHYRCHHLIHLELPFNPNRLEQRNGRIDRFGQEKTPIVRYLYLCGTFEQRILLRLIAKYERQRKRLTFVPNTLGLTTSTDAAAGRLLQGLMDENEQLFKEQEVKFDLVHDNDQNGADPATRELLEEIDRSLRGFEKAASANSWLGTQGLNAEASLFAEADLALSRGAQLNAVDLSQFVRDAVLLDGGEVNLLGGGIVELVLPPSWHNGLGAMPGFDIEHHRVRLTDDLEITRDAQDREVGFLGRAHPLVRRALDRVRNLSLGGATNKQDPRVSAVAGDVPGPTLIFTFLGRIYSRAGRELERLLAVQFSESGEKGPLPDNKAWLQFADPRHAINTRDIWTRHFEEWAKDSQPAAQELAAKQFKPLAAQFVSEYRSDLQRERVRQQEWLEQRAAEIIGDRGAAAVQVEMFGRKADSSSAPEPASWAKLADATDRLSGFATDPNQPPHLRHEANGVLSLFKQRKADLDAREALQSPEVVPLGLLMIVPQSTLKGGRG